MVVGRIVECAVLTWCRLRVDMVSTSFGEFGSYVLKQAQYGRDIVLSVS